MNTLSPWYFVTLTGEPRIWLVLTGMLIIAYFICRKKVSKERKKTLKKGIMFFVISIWIVMLATLLIKYVTDIQRPCSPCFNSVSNSCNPYCLEDPSFPSGHTSIIFAVFSSLYLIWKKKRFLPIFIIPIMVGFSRIVLNVHSPVDVLVGMLIGLFTPIAIFEIYGKISTAMRRKM